jgi:hypothetical protein
MIYQPSEQQPANPSHSVNCNTHSFSFKSQGANIRNKSVFALYQLPDYVQCQMYDVRLHNA